MLMRITRLAATTANGIQPNQTLLVAVGNTNTFVQGTDGTIDTIRFVNPAGTPQNSVDVSNTSNWNVGVGYFNVNGSFHAQLSN